MGSLIPVDIYTFMHQRQFFIICCFRLSEIPVNYLHFNANLQVLHTPKKF